MFSDLPVKEIKLTEIKEAIKEDLLNGKYLSFFSFLFSLIHIFENLPDISIDWGDFEKLSLFSNKSFNVEDIWGY